MTVPFTTQAFVAEDGGPVLQEIETPRPGPGEVLIEVAAAGVNRADLMQAAGLYPPPPGAPESLGLEAAGTVAAVGEGIDETVLGTRVCALLSGGGYASHAIAHRGSLLGLPDAMSFEEGACLAEAMMTVQANVFDRCALAEGEAFLCQGATSGIGVMALQMAREAGAGAIFGTAGSAAKCEVAEKLGATRAINYREEDFAEIVKAEGGADVVLDMVGGDYVQKHISVAKVNGRICNIAYQNGASVELNLMPLFLKRVILTGTTLRARSDAEKEAIRDRVADRFWPAVEAGRIVPVIDTVVPFADAARAHQLMKSGGHIGKIVLAL